MSRNSGGSWISQSGHQSQRVALTCYSAYFCYKLLAGGGGGSSCPIDLPLSKTYRDNDHVFIFPDSVVSGSISLFRRSPYLQLYNLKANVRH